MVTLLSPLQLQQILISSSSLVASRSGTTVGDVNSRIKPLSSILLIYFLIYQSLVGESRRFLWYGGCFPSIILILQSYRRYSRSLSVFFRRNPLIQCLYSFRRRYIILSLVKARLPFYKFLNICIYNLAAKKLSIYSLKVFLKEIVKITREDLIYFFYYIVTIN